MVCEDKSGLLDNDLQVGIDVAPLDSESTVNQQCIAIPSKIPSLSVHGAYAEDAEMKDVRHQSESRKRGVKKDLVSKSCPPSLRTASPRISLDQKGPSERNQKLTQRVAISKLRDSSQAGRSRNKDAGLEDVATSEVIQKQIVYADNLVKPQHMQPVQDHSSTDQVDSHIIDLIAKIEQESVEQKQERLARVTDATQKWCSCLPKAHQERIISLGEKFLRRMDSTLCFLIVVYRMLAKANWTRSMVAVDIKQAALYAISKGWYVKAGDFRDYPFTREEFAVSAATYLDKIPADAPEDPFRALYIVISHLPASCAKLFSKGQVSCPYCLACCEVSFPSLTSRISWTMSGWTDFATCLDSAEPNPWMHSYGWHTTECNRSDHIPTITTFESWTLIELHLHQPTDFPTLGQMPGQDLLASPAKNKRNTARTARNHPSPHNIGASNQTEVKRDALVGQELGTTDLILEGLMTENSKKQKSLHKEDASDQCPGGKDNQKVGVQTAIQPEFPGEVPNWVEQTGNPPSHCCSYAAVPLEDTAPTKGIQGQYGIISLFDGVSSVVRILKQKLQQPPAAVILAELDEKIRSLVCAEFGYRADEQWCYTTDGATCCYVRDVNTIIKNDCYLLRQVVAMHPNLKWFIVGGSPCQDLTYAGPSQGLLGLVGSQSRLFFVFLCTIRTMQVLAGTAAVRFLVENAGSMKPVHYVAFCRLLGLPHDPPDRYIWDHAKHTPFISRKRNFFRNFLDFEPVSDIPNFFDQGCGPLLGHKGQVVVFAPLLRTREVHRFGICHSSWTLYQPHALVWGLRILGRQDSLFQCLQARFGQDSMPLLGQTYSTTFPGCLEEVYTSPPEERFACQRF